LARPQGEQTKWRNLGEAKRHTQDSPIWVLPPVFLASSGQRLQLVAIISPIKIHDLSDDEKKKNIASQSKPVRLLIEEEAVVEIMKINDREVTVGTDMIIRDTCSIVGTLGSGESPREGRVLIYVRPGSGPGQWRLIGDAKERTGQTWKTLPVSVGKSGDRLIMVAVLATEPIPDLDNALQGKIKAISPQVVVRIE
jgi:hypothetical protein